MGGFAFEDLSPSKIASLREFSQSFWATQKRRPVIALDMSNHIGQVSTAPSNRLLNTSHQTLVRRLVAMLKVGCALVGVFDGPLIEEKRRHSKLFGTTASGNSAVASAHERAKQLAELNESRQFGPMVEFARQACSALGIAQLEATAEAEALCAWLQREGHVDAVFSADADVLANGATRVLRYLPPTHPAAVKASAAEDRLLAIYELDPTDASRFAMLALILGDDWEPGLRGIGKKTALALCKPKTGFAGRLVDLVNLQKQHGSNFGIELKRLQFHDDFADELASNEHGWMTRKYKQPIPESFPSIARFDRIMNPEKSPGPEVIVLCAEAKRGGDPLLPFHKRRLAELIALWTRPCPGLELEPGSTEDLAMQLARRNRVEDAASAKLFRSTIAPLIVANVLMQRRQEAELMTFKEVKKGRDVQVTTAAFTVPPFDAHFLVGSKVARFVFDLSGRSPEPQKASHKNPRSSHPEQQPATTRENSVITRFFAKRQREGDEDMELVTQTKRVAPNHVDHETSHAGREASDKTDYTDKDDTEEDSDGVTEIVDGEVRETPEEEDLFVPEYPIKDSIAADLHSSQDESDIEILEVNAVG